MSTLDCGVKRVIALVAESYTSSTTSRKEDGFAGRQYCWVCSYDRISKDLRAWFFNSPAVLFRIGWKYWLRRSCLNTYCNVSVEYLK